MPAAPPVRLLRRIMPVVSVVLSLYGCSDAAAPVAPRLDTRPHALEASVIVVTNTDDSGPGSLRQAILDATEGSVIHFDPAIAGQTIRLATPLAVSATGGLAGFTIEGPVPEGITLSGNLSTRVINVFDNAVLTMRNLSIVDGRAVVGSGGVEILNGRVTLDHVLVANNQGEIAGGIDFDNGQLILVNSTISGNVGEITGGIASIGPLVARNSTIAANVGGATGGINFIFGTFTPRNSIIADNLDSESLPSNCSFEPGIGMLLLGRNISSDGTCGDSDDGYLILAPKLGPLADNGGPTKTHALMPDSPALDAGTACTETTDQRYVARPQGASCDVGAFEFNDYGTYAITVGPNVAVNAKTGVITLTGTISCSKPTTQLGLNVNASQTQKTTGRFTAIVQADGFVGFSFCGPSPTSWSVPLTPQTGKFEPGSATGTASTGVYAANFIPATVTSPLKVFQVK
jgi:hypothetical protein